jgi:hypothetical protein
MQVRRTRLAEYAVGMGRIRITYKTSVGKPEGKSPLGRPRSRWESKIEMDLK